MGPRLHYSLESLQSRIYRIRSRCNYWIVQPYLRCLCWCRRSQCCPRGRCQRDVVREMSYYRDFWKCYWSIRYHYCYSDDEWSKYGGDNYLILKTNLVITFCKYPLQKAC